ncbi:hypothetical protein [Halosegnis sp.]|uniref:hypothetical protein n=1 Tax=Halosegnis sp. TaxID=2864959 RepID=UPI0035D406FA
MGTRLTHIPFDIETTGFETSAQVTVVGFGLPLGCRVFLNADGRPADGESLQASLAATFDPAIRLSVHASEPALLEAVAAFCADTLAPREYLLVAYNGERFHGGFDLPFLRTRCARQGRDWPFDGIPYADILPLVQDRFNTTAAGEDHDDLVGAYEELVGGPLSARDPFADSGAAVDAFAAGEFQPLLAHNLADIRRTGALAALARQYCGTSEFSLRSLTPTARDPDLS